MEKVVRESVRLICALAIKPQIMPILTQFQSDQNIEVHSLFDVNPNVGKRIQAGEKFDVGITNPCYVEQLITEGKVDPQSHVGLGRVPLALGKKGISHSIVANSVADIRKLLLAAKTVAYTGDGTSGVTFLQVLNRLDIFDEMFCRIRPLSAGQAPITVAAGINEYAVAPLSLILAADGIDPIAIFPSEVGADIDMSIFSAMQTTSTSLANKLIKYLTDSSVDAALVSGGIVRFKLNS
jgi:hypothetical protein